MDITKQQPEGVDGSIVLFRERLWPGLGICLFLTVMTASLGIAYGHAYGSVAGLLVGFTSTGLVVGSLFINAPIIAVDELVIRAGKARLPLKFAGDVRALDKAATAAAVRETAHRQAYLLVRSWIRDSIVITVTDTSDPHPYWQVSTRKLTELTRAIDSAKITHGGNHG